MNELSICVERVVRPIRASGRRKDRFREELLWHLTQVYDQEVAACGDDRQALERAAERLGDPQVLRKELQASVPAVERLLWSPIPVLTPGEGRLSRLLLRKTGESPFRHSVRMALLWIGFSVAANAIAAGTRAFLGVPILRILQLAQLGIALTASVSFALFFHILLSHGIAGATQERPISLQKMFLFWCYCLLSAAVMICAGMLFCNLTRNVLEFTPNHVFGFTALIAVWPVLFGAVANEAEREARRREEWESLGIA